MNSRRMITKIFAIFFLIFVTINILAQPPNVPSIYELPEGTILKVQMDNGIGSKVSRVNDTFTATLIEPVKNRESVVLPIGVIIEGKVLKVKPAATGNRSGSLNLSFETMRFENGEKREIQGVLRTELVASSNQTIPVVTVIGGTALGGILGAVSKANNGALIGVGIGAGVGTAIAFLRKGKDVKIVTDETFEIRLTKAVTLPVRDF